MRLNLSGGTKLNLKFGQPSNNSVAEERVYRHPVSLPYKLSLRFELFKSFK
jgi:hypothetical protein